MIEREFLERWHAEYKMYEAWGECVATTVMGALSSGLKHEDRGKFVKVPATPRCKDDRSLLSKAFYRGKPYANPYDDITDKVGCRFVVLLARDIWTVADALENISDWSASKDRDYDEEQKKNPIAFDYAAVHYVVRPKASFTFSGVTIAANTPCEVQIKTILHHAYSELTHDTIYKPQINATPAMRRNAAKSMALIEATNDYFEKVADEVSAAIGAMRDATHTLSSLYRDRVGPEPQPSEIEGMLLDAFAEEVTPQLLERVERALNENAGVIDRIKERAPESLLFRQPAILLAYALLAENHRKYRRKWPLTTRELEPLLTHLGIAPRD